MPVPSSWLSTDHALYELLYKPIAQQICVVNPNTITIACFLMVAPILWGLINRWPLWIMILIMFIRQSLDCMDGAVARACDKKTKLGQLMDLAEDALTFAVLGGFVLWTLWGKHRIPSWIKWVFSGLCAYAMYVYINHFVGALNNEEVPMNIVVQGMHDNTVVLSMLAIVGIHKIIAL